MFIWVNGMMTLTKYRYITLALYITIVRCIKLHIVFRQTEPSNVRWTVIKPYIVLIWALVQMTVFLLTECHLIASYLTCIDVVDVLVWSAGEKYTHSPQNYMEIGYPNSQGNRKYEYDE
jgi:hypothetical protein